MSKIEEMQERLMSIDEAKAFGLLNRLEYAIERKDAQGFADCGKYRKELLDGIKALRLRCAEEAKIAELEKLVADKDGDIARLNQEILQHTKIASRLSDEVIGLKQVLAMEKEALQARIKQVAALETQLAEARGERDEAAKLATKRDVKIIQALRSVDSFEREYPEQYKRYMTDKFLRLEDVMIELIGAQSERKEGK